MRTAGVIFDIYDDPHYQVIQKGESEKIASCEVATPEALNKLPDSAFGLIVKTASGQTLRKYPRHSDDARAISSFYFEKQAEHIPEGYREKVQSALSDPESGAVTIDINKLAMKQTPSKHFGLTVEGNGYFPIDNEEQVKEAAANFNVSCDKLQPHERYEYAQNLIKRASANGLNWEDLDETGYIRRYAGTELNKVAWMHGVRQRSMECFDMDKVAALKAYEPRDAAAAVRYLNEWDKLAKVDGKHTVPDAFQSVFYIQEKVASKTDSLKKISEEQLKTAFDQSFIDQWKEDPVSVYESLPNPVKSMIDEKFL